MRLAVGTGLVLLAAAAALALLYLRDGGVPGVPGAVDIDTAGATQTAAESAQVRAATSPSEVPPPDSGAQVTRSASQAALEAYERSPVRAMQALRDDLQAFVREAELLPAQDHEPRARELLAEVETFEESGYLTAPEALALRLSLLRYALPPDEYRVAAETLVSDARERAEQAERDWAARSDPRLERYRQLEREIVEESLSMTEFPDGMTRQAYLRERLQALRSEMFSGERDGEAGE